MSQVPKISTENSQKNQNVQNKDLLHNQPAESSDHRHLTKGQKQRHQPQYNDHIHQSIGTICERIIQVIIPVTLCTLYSAMAVRILSWSLTSDGTIFGKTWRNLGMDATAERNGYQLTAASAGTTTGVSTSLLVVVIFCLLIISITLVILMIFYMEWQNCLVYYFYIPTLIILAIVTPALIREILRSLNWFSVDIITASILTWNYTIFGIVAIFGLILRAPVVCQKFYLIHNSAVLSVIILHVLPGWAPWLLLLFLILWDLFAVLSPIGPLKLILKMAERSGVVDMPGILYSTDNSPSPSETQATSHSTENSQQQQRRQRRPRPNYSPQPQLKSDGARPPKQSSSEQRANNARVGDDSDDIDDDGAREGHSINARTESPGRDKVGDIPTTSTHQIKTIDSETSLTMRSSLGQNPTDHDHVQYHSSTSGTASGTYTLIKALLATNVSKPGPSGIRLIGRSNYNDTGVGAASRRRFDGGRYTLEKSVSIGLGDFIFYSLLVAITAKDRNVDTFYTVFATLIAVLFGLILTLALLVFKKQTLPALPVSIGLGFTVAFLTMHYVPSLSNRLAVNLIFI